MVALGETEGKSTDLRRKRQGRPQSVSMMLISQVQEQQQKYYHQIKTSSISSAIFSNSQRSPSIPNFNPPNSSSSQNSPSNQCCIVTGSGVCCCEKAIQCSFPLGQCTSMTFLAFFPTVDLHFSLKRSKVLDVDVKLNFLRVLRTQLLTSKPFISLQEFLRSLESEKRPEIFFSLGNLGTILCSQSLIVTLLLSSVWKYDLDWLSSISRTDWHSLSLLLRPSSLGQKDALDQLGWQRTSLLAWIAVILFLLILLRQSSILVASSIEYMFCTRSHSGICDSTIARNASTNYFSPSRPVLSGIMQAPEKISQLIHTRIVLLSMKIIPTVGRKNPQMAVSATKLLKILSSCSQGLPS